MYLSKLVPDPRSGQVQAELANPYELHRTLMSAFPGHVREVDRVLYRLETQRTAPYLVILVQSELHPDWRGLEQRKYLLQPVAVKQFASDFAAGQTLAFRLLANPTRRLGSNAENAGKRVGLYKVEEQQAWLARKAQDHGFSVVTATITNLSGQDAEKRDERGQKVKLRHQAVAYEGILRIAEPEKFARALAEGIGSAKGFGFGLLSLAPVQEMD